MGIFKRNINALLATILIHLLVIVVAMFLTITTSTSHEESYTYVEMDFIEEIMEEINAAESAENSEEFDIEKYISEIRNVGSNSPTNSRQNNNMQAMTQEELRIKYETELLREKYGDEYENMINRTYESYLPEDYNSNSNSDRDNNNRESSVSSYSGPALVYVELDNPNRGNSYIHVPVFTCKDGGTVVINITISSDGRVKSANVASAKSKGDVECISISAKDAALKSRFTTISGSGNESGKITYQFIEQ